MVDRTVNVIFRARDQLTQTLQAANNAIDRFGRESREAQTEATSAGDAFTRLGQSVRTLNSRVSSLRIGGEFTEELNKARGALQGFQQSVGQYLTQTGTLTRQQRRQAGVVGDLEANLRGLTDELNKQEQTLRESGASQSRINATTKELRTTIREQTAALKTARTEETRLANARRRSANSLATANINVREASQGLDQLQQQATEAGQAYTRAGTAVRRSFLGALSGQRQAVANLNQSFIESSEEAQRLGRALSRTAQPSEELVQSFNRAREAAARTRTEFRTQQEILAQMRRTLRDSGGDLSSLATSYRGFAQNIGQAETSFSRFRQELRQSAEATDRLNAAQGRASGNARRFAGAIQPQALQAASDAIDRFGRESREAQGSADNAGNAFIQLGKAVRTLNSQVSTLRIGGEFTEELNRARGSLQGFQQTVVQYLNQTDRLTRQQRRQASVVSDLEAKLRGLTDELNKQEQTLRESGASQSRINASTRELRTTINEQTSALRQARAEETRLATARRQSAASLEAANRNVKESSQALDQLQQQANEAGQAYTRAGTAVRRSFLGALSGQRQAVANLNQSFIESSEAAQRLGRALSRTAHPSEELVQSFNRARAAAARTRSEFRAQQEILGQMRRTLRDSGGDLSTLATNYRGFAQNINQAEASFTRFRQELSQSAEATDRLNSAQGRVRGNIGRVSTAMRQQSRATGQARAQVTGLSSAWEDFYGRGSRQSLSFLQRFRGQILSLTAAYVGLFGVIRGFQNIIETFRILEAAQARLAVVFEGDNARIEDSFDRLERTARRLGLRFGDLAQEYSAFAIATQNTALEGDATARIFRQVAEAARVNNLSLDQTRGVFTALQQIVSKGTLSMEELRQQLGDRIPGAVRIYADALDLSVEQLFKLVEAGAISSDTLVQFGDELERRFGGDNLENSLNTIGAAFGRLQNQIFLAFKQIGDAGAIDALRDLFNDLSDTLASADFSQLLEALGRAIARVSGHVGVLVRNFDLVVIGIGAIVATRFAPFFNLLLQALLQVNQGLQRSSRRLQRYRRQVSLTNALLRQTTVSFRNFSRVLTGFLSGNLITLALGGIAAYFLTIRTRADDATESLFRVREVLGEILDLVDRASDPEQFFQSVGNIVSEGEIEAQIAELQRQRQALVREAENQSDSGIFSRDTPRVRVFRNLMLDTLQALANGDITIGEFNDQLDRLRNLGLGPLTGQALEETRSRFNQITIAVGEAALKVTEMTESQQQLETTLDGLRGSAEAQGEAFNNLRGEIEATDNTQRASVRQARALGQQANELIQQRTALVSRLFQQYAAGASEADIAATESQIADINEAARGRLEESITALRDAVADLSDTEYTASLRTLLASEIANFENIAADLDRSLQTQRANFFNTQLQAYERQAETLRSVITQNISEGQTVDQNQDLIRNIQTLSNIAVEQARASLAELQRVEEVTPEIEARMLRLANFIASVPNQLAEDIFQFANQEIERLLDIRNQIQEDLEGAIASGDADRQRNATADLEENTRIIRDRTVALLADAEALGLQGAQLEELARQNRIYNDELRSSDTGTSELQRLQTEFNNLQQLRQALQQEVTRAFAAGNIEETEAARQELALVENQLRGATNALDDYISSLGDVSPELRQLQLALRAVNADLDDGSVEVEITNVRNQITELQNLRNTLSNTPVNIGNLGDVRQSIEEINAELRESVDTALEFVDTLDQTLPSTQILRAELQAIRAETTSLGNSFMITFNELAQTLQGSIKSGLDVFVEGVAMGRSAIDSLADGFRQFAANFLRRIAEMITEQLAFNAAQSILGGIGGGGLFGGLFNFHTGGTVGAAAGGARLPQGRDSLRNNEILAVLERGETVLTQDQSSRLGQGQQGGNAGVTVINTIDAPSFLDEALRSRDGQEVLLNAIRAERSAIRSTLGV